MDKQGQVRGKQAELAALLARGPVRRRAHPALATTIARALRAGRITAVFPGVYLPIDQADDTHLLLRAAELWDPTTVVTGRYAAQRQFWPELGVGEIELAVAHQRVARPSGFVVSHRRIPEPWVGRWDGIRMTRPALTAVDLCVELGNEVLDRALRSRKVTVQQVQRALEAFPGRRGNRLRTERILDSRGGAWAYSERLCHRLLRSAGLTAWRGNPPIMIRGNLYHPDILFDEHPAVIEVDGLHHALNPTTYRNDLRRQNDFATEGYRMLRYTVTDLEQRPDQFLEDVHALLRHLRRR